MPIRVPKKTTATVASRSPALPPSGRKAFYTVAELAVRWSLSERHIRRLIDNGEVVAHRIGRAVRVSAANVALFEARCAQDL